MKPSFAYRLLIAWVSFMFLVSFASAQHSKTDSLNKAYRTATQDTEKVNTLNRLSHEYEISGNLPIADSAAKQALRLATKIGFKSGEALAYSQIGRIYNDQGDYDNALNNFSKSLALQKELNDKRGIAGCLNRIGLSYKGQGNYAQALDYFKKSLEAYSALNDKRYMAFEHDNIGDVYSSQGKYPEALTELFNALKVLEEVGDKYGIANTHETIGIIYSNENEFQKALEEHKNALKLREEMHDTLYIANSYSNIGLTYSEQGNDSLALEFYNRSLKIRNNIGDKNGIAISLINIGGIYFSEKKYNDALDYFNRSLDLFEKIGNKNGVANCLDAVAQIYLEQKNYKEALTFENKYLAIVQEMGALSETSTADQRLSDINENLGNYKDALKYQKAYISTHDSIFNKENTKKTVAAEMNFKFEKQQSMEKEEQEKKDLIEKEQQRKQRLTIYFISGILILVFGFAIFAYRSYLQKQRVNLELDVKNQKIESAYKELGEKNKDITDSINYAKRIQDAILPPLSIIKKHIPESFILYKPKDIVAGDFYWMEFIPIPPDSYRDFPSGGEGVKSSSFSPPLGRIQEGIVLIAACDCTGHGVPGAMVSVVCSNAMNRALKEFKITETGKLLDKTRELVLETFEKSESDVQDGMDISFCAITRPSGNEASQDVKVEWSGANNPLWYIHNNEFKEISADKQPIGKQEGQRPFSTHTLKLKKGDTLYLFTDGYADQFGGPKGKKFKYKQLEEKLLSMASLSMDNQREILEQTLANWQGDKEQVDDVLVIGVRI